MSGRALTRRARRESRLIVNAWTHRATKHVFQGFRLPGDLIRELSGGTAHIDDWCSLEHDPDGDRFGCFFKGVLLGYLDETVTANYRSELNALRGRDVIVQFPIQGGWNLYEGEMGQSWTRAYFTVMLPPPGHVIPRTAPPAMTHVLLPPGTRVKVTKTEAHIDALRPWLSDDGEAPVHATLHPDLDRLGKVLLVRIDGRVVGELTDRMGEQYLPLVAAFSDAGVTTTSRAVVTGNGLAAGVVLYPARPSEITNAWIREQLAAIEG